MMHRPTRSSVEEKSPAILLARTRLLLMWAQPFVRGHRVLSDRLAIPVRQFCRRLTRERIKTLVR